MGLAVAALLSWVVFLSSRERTAWSELEQRRPHRTTAGGILYPANTAWGTPLFGREVTAHYASAAVRGFLLANLPAVILGDVAYGFLEMTPLRVEVISFTAGVFVLGLSMFQWFALGLVLARIRRHVPAV